MSPRAERAGPAGPARPGWIARCVAALLAAVAIPGPAPEARSIVAQARHVDAPLLRIACDELPLKSPTPIEMNDDRRERPYFALIRVFRFPSLEPIDVPVERVQVRGAATAARVAPGEYLFSGIELGYTAAVLLEEPGEAVAPVDRTPGRRSLATRNPLVLARHAITTCDLYVLEQEKLDGTMTLKGRVIDRTTGLPLAGARVKCGEPIVTTDADGRFTFAEPVTWRSLFHQTIVDVPGYRRIQMSPNHLSAPWVKRLLQEGEAAFALMPEDQEGPGRDKRERETGLLPRLDR